LHRLVAVNIQHILLIAAEIADFKNEKNSTGRMMITGIKPIFSLKTTNYSINIMKNDIIRQKS
jgi:hypothetical protein